MIKQALLPILAVMALSVPAMAQDCRRGAARARHQWRTSGPCSAAAVRPAPFVTAHDVQNGMTAADHQAQNQNMITKLRGDAGFLAGFSMGTPLAASRQARPELPRRRGLWLSPPPSRPRRRTDHYQQRRTVGTHRRQRQRGSAAIRERIRTDRTTAGGDQAHQRFGRRGAQSCLRRRQYHPACARRALIAAWNPGRW